MAQFMGGLTGQRDNLVTRLGSKKSGLRVFANGWHLGIEIYARYNEATGKDEFIIVKTGGSQHPFAKETIARITE